MLVLLAMGVGILWIVGAVDTAKNLASLVVILSLGWVLVSCVWRAFANASGSVDVAGLHGVTWALLAFVSLVGFGSLRWHGRDRRKKAVESFRRSNLHPRHRALPSPPPDEDAR